MGMGQSRGRFRRWVSQGSPWPRRAAGGGLALALCGATLAAAPAQARTLEGVAASVPAAVVAVAPDAPTDVTAVAGPAPDSVTVTWAAPANTGGSAILDYRIASQPGQHAAVAAASATSAEVTGLSPGVPYTFTVRARNVDGSSVPSTRSNEVTLGNGTISTVPDAPTDVSAVAGDGSATLSWTPPANDGGAALTKYRMIVQPGGTWVEVGAPATSGDFPGLLNGSTYSFTVRAYNDVGGSASSGASNSVVPGSGGTATNVPSTPTGVTATVASPTSAQVSWTTPTSDGGSPITGYRVTAQPGGKVLDTSSTATTALFSGLTSGGTYTFTVQAINTNGISSSSVASAPLSLGGPASVPDIPRSVVAAAGSGSATVTWAAPVSDGGSPVTSYRVTSQPGTVSLEVGATVRSARVPLTPGVKYTLTVRAVNGVGSSASDARSNVVTPSRIGGFDLLVAPGDFSGDGRADLLARKANGDLFLYAGNGTGGWAAAGRKIGSGWQMFTSVFSPGDFSGDHRPDVIGRKANGELWLYVGNGSGGWAASGRRIGTGWGNFNAFMTTRDFSGDGKNDILARTSSGEIWLFRGNGAGGWAAAGKAIGWGWGAFDVLMSPRDFTGDRRPDVLARKTNGELWLYAGNGAGGWAGAGRLVNTRFGAFDTIVGPGDFTGDGRNDILGRTPTTGELYLYPGNAAGGWFTGRRIGTGW